MEISNMSDSEIKRNRLILLGIILGLILLVVLGVWWLA